MRGLTRDLAAFTVRLASTVAIGGVASCMVSGCFAGAWGGLVAVAVVAGCVALFFAGLLGFLAWRCARCAAAALCPELARKIGAAAGAVLGSGGDASFADGVRRLAVGVLAAAVVACAGFSLTGNGTEAMAVPPVGVFFFVLSVLAQAAWRGAAEVLAVLFPRLFAAAKPIANAAEVANTNTDAVAVAVADAGAGADADADADAGRRVLRGEGDAPRHGR